MSDSGTDTTATVALPLSGLEWSTWVKPGATGRVKIAYSGSRRFRLLELPPGFEETEWCLRGHVGYVFEGEFVVMFQDRESPCSPGMAFDIPDGDPHRSRGAPSSPTVVFVVDDVVQ